MCFGYLLYYIKECSKVFERIFFPQGITAILCEKSSVPGPFFNLTRNYSNVIWFKMVVYKKTVHYDNFNEFEHEKLKESHLPPIKKW